MKILRYLLCSLLIMVNFQIKADNLYIQSGIGLALTSTSQIKPITPNIPNSTSASFADNIRWTHKPQIATRFDIGYHYVLTRTFSLDFNAEALWLLENTSNYTNVIKTSTTLPTPLHNSLSTKIGSIVVLFGLRPTYQISNRWRVFSTLAFGPAFSKGKATFTDNGVAYSQNCTGNTLAWQLGLGLSYKFAHNIALSVNESYYDLGKINFGNHFMQNSPLYDGVSIRSDRLSSWLTMVALRYNF